MIRSTFALCLLFAAALGLNGAHIQGRGDLPKGYYIDDSVSIEDTEITYTFFLRSCNFEVLDKFFWDVSNPKHDLYGKYMKLEELNDLITCDLDDVKNVLDFINDYQVKEVKVIGPTAISVTSTVKVATQMLEADFHAIFNKKNEDKPLIRAMGSVKIPLELHHIVDFIGGISELGFEQTKLKVERQTKDKVKQRLASRVGLRQDFNPNTFDITDMYVTPILLQDMYGIPNTPLSPESTLGIAAFDNDYDKFGFCRFQDLFGGYRNPPTFTQTGPQVGSDEIESDLDVQYSSALASGGTFFFANHKANQWILDWATASVQDKNRPYVWSISYGWPEIWQCVVVSNLTTDCPTGYTYQKYIQAVNVQLASLGSLGTTVMVSSGDSGTPGFSTNCPLDSNVPEYNAEANNGAGGFITLCQEAFGGDATCNCSNFLVTFTYEKNNTAINCAAPAGLVNGDPNCDIVLGEAGNPEIATLCTNALNTFSAQSPSDDCQFYGEGAAEGGFILATCDCNQLKPASQTKKGFGTCTISGYDYENFAPAFFPDFPTTSPYVTSVGATATLYTSSECQPSIFRPEIYAYTNDPAGFSGGGGFSSFQPAFNAQYSAVQRYISQNAGSLPPASTFNASNRAYPDVSFNGHNFMVSLGLAAAAYEGAPSLTDSGIIYPIGGTSASSPSFAGMIARINDYLIGEGLPVLGPINQLLYAMAEENPSSFNDITGPQSTTFLNFTVEAGVNTNCNEDYCCQFGFVPAPGWDPATGLGTPNYPEMMKYIISLNSARTRKPNPIN